MGVQGIPGGIDPSNLQAQLMQASLRGVGIPGGIGVSDPGHPSAPAELKDPQTAGLMEGGARMLDLSEEQAATLDRIFTITGQEPVTEEGDPLPVTFNTEAFGVGFQLGAYSSLGAGLTQANTASLAPPMTGQVGLMAGFSG